MFFAVTSHSANGQMMVYPLGALHKMELPRIASHKASTVPIFSNQRLVQVNTEVTKQTL